MYESTLGFIHLGQACHPAQPLRIASRLSPAKRGAPPLGQDFIGE
jgi:hypothetical protein